MVKCFYCAVGKKAFDFHLKCAVPLKNIVTDCGGVVLHFVVLDVIPAFR